MTSPEEKTVVSPNRSLPKGKHLRKRWGFTSSSVPKSQSNSGLVFRLFFFFYRWFFLSLSGRMGHVRQWTKWGRAGEEKKNSFGAVRCTVDVLCLCPSTSRRKACIPHKVYTITHRTPTMCLDNPSVSVEDVLAVIRDLLHLLLSFLRRTRSGCKTESVYKAVIFGDCRSYVPFVLILFSSPYAQRRNCFR